MHTGGTFVLRGNITSRLVAGIYALAEMCTYEKKIKGGQVSPDPIAL